MKTNHFRIGPRRREFLGAALAIATAATALAQSPTMSSTYPAAGRREAVPASTASEVTLTRATSALGLTVLTSDGRKAGEIVDYIFDTAAAPHLRYVLVSSGELLGGETRAVPAAAITAGAGVARLGISSEQYARVPTVPRNRIGYLSDSSNTAAIASAFGVAPEPSVQAQSGDEQPLVSFSRLENTQIFGRNRERLGRLVDAWVGLGQDAAPYVEVRAPSADPFEETVEHGYAVPMSEIQPLAHDAGVDSSLTRSSLYRYRPIGDTPGVHVLRSFDGQGPEVIGVDTTQR